MSLGRCVPMKPLSQRIRASLKHIESRHFSGGQMCSNAAKRLPFKSASKHAESVALKVRYMHYRSIRNDTTENHIDTRQRSCRQNFVSEFQNFYTKMMHQFRDHLKTIQKIRLFRSIYCEPLAILQCL